jgi:adenosylcobinamide-GDP ribazoletransferase
MRESDMRWLHVGDIAVALSLLSRWPLRISEAAYGRSAQAVWAYPVAGVLIALPAAGLAQLCLGLGLSTGVAALLALACLTVSTGAMHEDGLADSADGLWGGHDTARRLEIMKDSRIGAYGVLALIFGLGLRWLALSELFESGAVLAPILVAAALSRVAPTVLMLRLPQARTTGLSQSVGTPQARHVGLAAILGALLAIIALQSFPLLVFFATALAITCCVLIAKYKLQGQNGDILGASQQVAEITILLCLSV